MNRKGFLKNLLTLTCGVGLLGTSDLLFKPAEVKWEKISSNTMYHHSCKIPYFTSTWRVKSLDSFLEKHRGKEIFIQAIEEYQPEKVNIRAIII